jgi:hypothetical protein
MLLRNGKHSKNVFDLEDVYFHHGKVKHMYETYVQHPRNLTLVGQPQQPTIYINSSLRLYRYPDAVFLKWGSMEPLESLEALQVTHKFFENVSFKHFKATITN